MRTSTDSGSSLCSVLAEPAGAIAELHQDAARPAAHIEVLWIGQRHPLFSHDPLETLDLRVDSTCPLEVEILRSGVAAADELRTDRGYGIGGPIEYGRDPFDKGQACGWVDAADAGHILLRLVQEFT